MLSKFGQENKLIEEQKLVVGQHGGGPFWRYNAGREFEVEISDLFVLLKWFRKPKKGRDVGQLASSIKSNIWDKDGRLTVVTVLMPKLNFDLRSMAMSKHMLNYFDDQQNL